MKKNTLFLLIILTIWFGLFTFGSKPASAYDSGCIGSGMYSMTTGQLCSMMVQQNDYYNNYSYGCTSTGPYNIITGQLCNGSSVNYPAANYPTTNYHSNFYGQQFSIGDRSSDILSLQQMLRDAGFNVGRIDGIYGRKTDAAYILYQESQNYSPTYPTTTLAPVITGVSGPQTLNINQQGTWTVTAYNTNGGNLSYSVNWGDQQIMPMYYSNNSANIAQQNSIFSHIYTQAGTYSPIFTVTNQNGKRIQSSLSVVVSSSYSNYTAPVIYSMSPSYGPVGTLVTIYGNGFNNNNCNSNYGVACTNSFSPNTINFGGTIIQNVYSYNGSNMTFTVPSSSNSCPAGLYCAAVYMPMNPGIYPVSVTNANGTSSTINFTVTY
ncbi:MAG: peptidoglycan-binding domain-containing protein [bacterium]